MNVEHVAAFSHQLVRMKKLSNDEGYTGRNLYITYFHLRFALNVAQVVFRAKYMLDAENQGVALEIMSFSRVLQTPEQRPTLEKVISMDSSLQEQEFC